MTEKSRAPFRILHITHTDIRFDYRILRSLLAGRDAGYEVRGLGVDAGQGPNPDLSSESQSGLTLLPRPPMSRAAVVLQEGISTTRRLEPAARRTPSWGKLILTLNYASAVARELREFRPQIIHAHDLPALFFAVMTGANRCGSVVYDAHELNSQRTGISKLGSGLTSFVERLFWSKIDLLVSVSSSICAWYETTYGPKKSVVIRNIHHPLPPAKGLQWDGQSARQLLNISEKTVVFAYVGALEEGRRLEEIVGAFSNMSAASGILLMLGDGSKKASLVALASDSGAVKFVEPIPNRFLPFFLFGVDYGMCLLDAHTPNEFMALPNKVFEYVAAGVRPVTSDFPELSRIAEQSDGLVWPEGDINARVAQLVSNGRPEPVSDSLRNAFSFDVEAKKLLDGYGDLMKRA